MRAAFDDISVPGFYVRAQHDPEKNKNKNKLFIFYLKNQKVFIIS